MSSPTPTPERTRREIERDLQDAVELARAEMQHATEPVARAAAAERLKAALQRLMDFTGTKH